MVNIATFSFEPGLLQSVCCSQRERAWKPKKRDTYTYAYKIGNKIVHRGITDDLERREGEHQQRWPKGHIKQVGRVKTEDSAREWEESQEKTITPPRKKPK